MAKTLLPALFAVGFGLMIALPSHDAQAFTTTFGAQPVQSSDVTTVAGGCGLGWYRGPWGGCRRNIVRAGDAFGVGAGASAAGKVTAGTASSV